MGKEGERRGRKGEEGVEGRRERREVEGRKERRKRRKRRNQIDILPSTQMYTFPHTHMHTLTSPGGRLVEESREMGLWTPLRQPGWLAKGSCS